MSVSDQTRTGVFNMVWPLPSKFEMGKNRNALWAKKTHVDLTSSPLQMDPYVQSCPALHSSLSLSDTIWQSLVQHGPWLGLHFALGRRLQQDIITHHHLLKLLRHRKVGARLLI